jgi:RimJ/RimL family protein N-acetyltransferase
MLAWVVDTRAQHRGYATEAARSRTGCARGVTTLTAHIHPRHIASQAVAKRIDPTPTDRIVGGETIWAVGPAGWLPQAEPAG